MADIAARLAGEIRAAAAEGRPLQIVAGGSKAFLGRETGGDLLDLSEHSGILNYQPVELVLTARAGTPITEIEAALAERNQMLACEPPRLGGAATLGGSLACNLSGPGRPWWGSLRDHVLGIRLLDGRGEHLRFGGQVMKNVAGFDVSRTMAGAMGTLGVITEVSLKVLPRPEQELTLTAGMEAAEAIETMNRLAGRPLPLTAACWLEGRLWLRLSGAGAAVDAAARVCPGEVCDEGAAFWPALRDMTLPFFAGEGAPLWRFSVRSTADAIPLDGPWLLDWGGAQRWWRGEGSLEQMAELARAAGGQVALFRGGDRQGERFQPADPVVAGLMRRLKSEFDPHGIFNPGRLWSWL